MKTILILLSLLFLTSASFARENINLLGQLEEDRVQLYWEVINWPKNAIGFKVSKKIDGKWRFLSDSTIYPHFDSKRDWAAQGFRKQDYEALNKKLKEHILAGKLTRMSKEDLLEKLEKYGQTGSGFRIKCKRDNYYKIFSGFYFVDYLGSEKPEKLEYGLHLVYKDGTVDEKPQSIETPVNLKEKFEIVPSFKVLDDNRLKINWKISEKDLRHKLLGGLKFTYDGKEIVAKKSNYFDKDDYVFSYELTVDATKDLVVAVAPQTIFHSAYQSTEVKFNANKYLALPDKLLLKKIIDRPNIKILWKLDKKYEAAVKQIVIKVSNARNFDSIDTVKVDGFHTEFTYKVKAKDQKTNELFFDLEFHSFNGKKTSSRPLMFQYFDPSMPPKVTGLKAVYNAKTESVDLSWNKEKNDRRTKGYRIYTDEIDVGELRQSSKMGLITGQKASYPVGQNYYLNRKSRIYTFQIQPVASSSEPASAATLAFKMPVLYLAPAYYLKANFKKDLDINFTWEYYKKGQYTPVDEVTGFRLILYKDLGEGKLEEYGKPIFLKADAREYKFVTPSNDDGVRINMKARIWSIAGKMESKKFCESPFSLADYRFSKNLMKGMTVDFKYDKTKHAIKYSWKFPPNLMKYEKSRIVHNMTDNSREKDSFDYSNRPARAFGVEDSTYLFLPKGFKRKSVDVKIQLNDSKLNLHSVPIIRKVIIQ